MWRLFICWAFLALLMSAPAAAEVISLDCTSPNGRYVNNAWVDLDKSIVTLQETDLGRPVPISSFSAQITPTSIKWAQVTSGGRIDWVIDRTTGILTKTLSIFAGGGGVSTYQCAKGSTPLPQTKF